MALALGLPSYPPNPQAGAHHGAVIAIPAAVRRAMQFGARARPFRRAAEGQNATLASWALRAGTARGATPAATVTTRQPDYDQIAQRKKSLDGDRPAHSFSQSFSMTVWLINFDYYVD